MTGNKEVEPTPTWDVLTDLVSKASYRPDWQVALTEVHRQIGGPGLRLDVLSVGFDSYHPDRGQTYRVRHSFIVPPASYNAQSWARWLLARFIDIETHEACEFLVIDGRRPFAPNHGPGHDPYMVRDLNTFEAAETTFRGTRVKGSQRETPEVTP